jgi:UTP--glucose-1-phosphate uridylyltransferase
MDAESADTPEGWKGGISLMADEMNRPSGPSSRVTWPIRKAVIPAAGLGTRMRPVTELIPKELLPIGTKPMIQYAIEDLITSGINDIFVVLNRSKELLRRYLTLAFSEKCSLHFGYQEAPSGIPAAIKVAEKFVNDENFVLAMPDVIFFGDEPLTKQLLARSKGLEGNVGVCVRIPSQRMKEFGYGESVQYRRISRNIFEVVSFTGRKKQLTSAPAFNLRGAGRTILSPKVFEYIDEIRGNLSEEFTDLQLYDMMINSGEKFFVVCIKGVLFDVGIPSGFLAANCFLRRRLYHE